MIQRGRQLQPAAADIGHAFQDFDAGIAGDRVARLVALLPVHQDLAGQDQRLRLFARFGQTAVDQQLIEPDFRVTAPVSTARVLAAARQCVAPTRSESASSRSRSARGRRTTVCSAQVRAGHQALLLRHFARPLDSIDGGKRDFLLLRVLARGLAQRFGRLLHVEHVVDDLKRQADMFAEARQAPRADRSSAPA